MPREFSIIFPHIFIRTTRRDACGKQKQAMQRAKLRTSANLTKVMLRKLTKNTLLGGSLHAMKVHRLWDFIREGARSHAAENLAAIHLGVNNRALRFVHSYHRRKGRTESSNVAFSPSLSVDSRECSVGFPMGTSNRTLRKNSPHTCLLKDARHFLLFEFTRRSRCRVT